MGCGAVAEAGVCPLGSCSSADIGITCACILEGTEYDTTLGGLCVEAAVAQPLITTLAFKPDQATASVVVQFENQGTEDMHWNISNRTGELEWIPQTTSGILEGERFATVAFDLDLASVQARGAAYRTSFDLRSNAVH